MLSSFFEQNCISITRATWTLRSSECRYRSAYSEHLYWMVMIEHHEAATDFHAGKEAPVPLGRRLCRGLRFFRRPTCRQITLQIRLFPLPVRNDNRMSCRTALTEVHTGTHSVSVARWQSTQDPDWLSNWRLDHPVPSPWRQSTVAWNAL